MLKVSEELDMTLLLFHLILSSFTFNGVDISVASKILKRNLKRYPTDIPMLCYPRIHPSALLFPGVFFLLWCRLSIPLSFSNPKKLSNTTVKPWAPDLNIAIFTISVTRR